MKKEIGSNIPCGVESELQFKLMELGIVVLIYRVELKDPRRIKALERIRRVLIYRVELKVKMK